MNKFGKRIISAALAAGTLFTVTPMPGPAYAMTIIDDAQTAVEKNIELFKKLWDKEEARLDFTQDDLENLIFGACEYSADKYVGMGFIVDSFRVKAPTATSDGGITATLIFYQDDAEEGFEVSKIIPATGNAADTDGSEDYAGDTDGGISASDAKAELDAASKAISDAIWNFEVSNDTTKNDILNMARAALPDASRVKVTLNPADFSLTKASTTVTGTVSATLTLTCGDSEKRCPVGKTIELVVTADSEHIKEDMHAVSEALDVVIYTNRTTKEEILEIARAAVKNGSKISWESFNMKKATFEEDGEIIAYMHFSLGDEERTVRHSFRIIMLERKIPTDKISINKEEWDILLYTNVERAKGDLYLYTTTDDIQRVADVREAELFELYSHTRPNGESCFTAIPDTVGHTGKLGENICRSYRPELTGKECVRMWVDSPGHYKNIMTPDFNYMACGYTDNGNDCRGVQMFFDWHSITSVTTSAGTMHFVDEDAMQKEYLICTTADGLVSYMPLDVNSMTKSGNTYTAKICKDGYAVFTVGDAADNNAQVSTPDTKQDSSTAAAPIFTDVSDGAYYANAVKWAVERKITAGTTATTFSPDATCTRAQILTFLWRAVGSPKATAANPFNDVSESDYYYNAAVWASEKGMVSGSSFDADTPCTRASTVTYMWKYFDSPEASYSGSFTDVSAASDYAKAVAWALDEGVTSGTSDTTFSPDMICSRGQIVTFLNRAMFNKNIKGD